MRERLVLAAVACLAEQGYAATTTQLVTDRAGVSRGAILHHFPTKADLMVAVAEYAARHQDEQVAAKLAGVEGGLPLYLAITTAAWAPPPITATRHPRPAPSAVRRTRPRAASPPAMEASHITVERPARLSMARGTIQLQPPTQPEPVTNSFVSAYL